MSAENASEQEKAKLKEESESNMPPNEADVPAASNAAKMDVPETEPLTGAESADPKVKFSGTSATVDLESGGAKEKQGFAPALTKSELMKYATDPFWVRLRWALFILFWLIWVGMLVSAVVIIIYAEKCPSPAPKQWWQKKPVYEVFVKSFKDSNDDGLGDLKGVESKLGYLSNLGVGSIYLSPFFKSPDKDNGFDVSDHKDIDPRYGTMDDFKSLLAAIHEQGMKLIIDFIPNHTSDQHPWFTESKAKKDQYKDYYIWHDGKGSGPPNNWKSILAQNSASAWSKDATRGQFYLHQFNAHQPDLNLRNPKVVKELEDVLNFWLDLGVDGFRVDGVGQFFEDENLDDDDDSKSKTYDLDGNEVLDLLQKFRDILDEKTTNDESNPRIMMTESHLPTAKLVRYYGNVNNQTGIGSISHLPLNSVLLKLDKADSAVTASKIQTTIEDYLNGLGKPKPWPNFCVGNHDHSRVASRLGNDYVDVMNMITLMLPGTAFTYYGEEIGMVDGNGQVSDPRLNYQTPMQWTSEANAGFSSANPAIVPVNTDFDSRNVDQLETVENSHLHVFREVASLRESETILFGNTNITVQDSVLMLTRIRKGNPGYVLIANLGDQPVAVEGLAKNVKNMAERGVVTLGVPRNEDFPVGSQFELTKFEIPGKQSYLLTFVPKF